MGFLISESAANPFIGTDGLINLSAVEALAKKASEAAKKLPEPPKVLGIYYTTKPLQKYLASAEKKGDHKYLTLRAQQIRVKKSRIAAGVKPELYVKKGKVLLVDYDGLSPALEKQLDQFLRAANSHNTKAEKVLGKVKTEKGKLRDTANADFEKASAEAVGILSQGGVKETNIIAATSMFGKTVIVKLPSGSYITIGKSDATKFAAAKKAAKAAAATAEK